MCGDNASFVCECVLFVGVLAVELSQPGAARAFCLAGAWVKCSYFSFFSSFFFVVSYQSSWE